MLSDLLYEKGQDRFENYKFSGKAWSAPCLEDPAKIRELLDSFHLVGRRIKKLRLIGLNYLLVRDRIEDSVYGSLAGLPEEERQIRSNYSNIDPTTLFPRCAQIDEPLLIMFEDEDVFEIDAPQEPIFCMSMNRIPWWIDAGTNLPNVYADVLFSPCIGKLIVDIEVHTYKTKEHPMYRCPFSEEPFERELVGNIVLRFEDGTGLSIGGWIDFALVQHIDSSNTETTITWEELQPGSFNWEDLHNDPVTGYEAESPSLFFGRKGAEHADTPFMSISSDSSAAVLHIPIDKFDLLGWCFAKATNAFFDEYGEYHFTYEQWHTILEEAKHILNIPFIFDEIKHFNDTSEVFMAHVGGWTDGKWGVIDRQGNWVAEPIFEDLGYDHWHGLITFYATNKWHGDDLLIGIYDLKTKEVLFEPQFLDVDLNEDRTIQVEIYDEKLGRTVAKIFDRTGKESFPSEYSSIYSWKEPYEVVIQDAAGDRHGLIDKAGKVLLPCKYPAIWDGLYWKEKRIIFEENGKQGLMDFDDNIIIPAIYHKIYGVDAPLLTVHVGDKDNYLVGSLDHNGNVIFPAKYSSISWLKNKTHLVCCKDGHCEVYQYTLKI